VGLGAIYGTTFNRFNRNSFSRGSGSYVYLWESNTTSATAVFTPAGINEWVAQGFIRYHLVQENGNFSVLFQYFNGDSNYRTPVLLLQL
jgi:hypothetical protein